MNEGVCLSLNEEKLINWTIKWSTDDRAFKWSSRDEVSDWLLQRASE